MLYFVLCVWSSGLFRGYREPKVYLVLGYCGYPISSSIVVNVKIIVEIIKSWEFLNIYAFQLAFESRSRDLKFIFRANLS